jgi:diacylglycerol kinase family enzyme
MNVTMPGHAHRPHRTRFVLHEHPIAGIARHMLTSNVLRELQRRGCLVTRLMMGVNLPDVDWAQLACENDAVISAGGDGTLRQLASHMPAGLLPVGIIPRGTGNVLASEIGLVKSLSRVADTLMHGRTVELTGARANGTPFYLMAGIGFDAEAVRRLDVETKRKWGKPAYARPILSALAEAPPRLHVSADGGREAEAGWVLVANARYYGGYFRLSAHAGFEKPDLVVHLVPRGNIGRRLVHATALGFSALQRMPGIQVWSASHLKITSEAPVAAQIDGDEFGTTPIEIKWGEPKLALIVPEAYAVRTASALATG